MEKSEGFFIGGNLQVVGNDYSGEPTKILHDGYFDGISLWIESYSHPEGGPDRKVRNVVVPLVIHSGDSLEKLERQIQNIRREAEEIAAADQ